MPPQAPAAGTAPPDLLPAWIHPTPTVSVVVHEEMSDGRSWIRLQHASPEKEPVPGNEEVFFAFDGVDGLRVRFDAMPTFVTELQQLVTRLVGITPAPDFAALADRYRFVETPAEPCQRNVTLAHLFAALAASGDAKDSSFLRDLDRVVAKHHASTDRPAWGAGAPSRLGRGVEATGKIQLVDGYHRLLALDDEALDERVAEQRTRRVSDPHSPELPPVDRDDVIAFDLLALVVTAMPHLDPDAHATNSPVVRPTTVATHDVVDAQGQRSKLVIKRVPDGDGPVLGPLAPGGVARLASHLREMRRTRNDDARGTLPGMFLRPDDMEPVLRKALRIAGLDATAAEGFFKFLDQRSRRSGSESVTKNRDQRRREKKSRRSR